MRGEPAVEWGLLATALALAWAGSAQLPADAQWPPGAPAPGALRVVTWNVGGPGDGRDGEPLRGEHASSVAETLRRLAFDLACVVEVSGREQARALAAATGCDRAGGWLASGGSRPLVLLARRGTLRGRPAAGEDEAARRRGRRRPRLLAQWEMPGGAVAELAALHAAPWSADERNLQVGGAAAHLAALSGPRLLLGDLNLEVQLDGRQDLFTDDAHRDLETYGFATRELVDVGRSAGATAEPDRRIDYVLASRELRAAAGGVARSARASGMDHAPLWVDLAVTPP